jgi:hypothetical protein
MRKQSVESIPANWEIDRWPKDLFPHDAKRAKSFVRRHRQELIACGALTRVGRFLVIVGAGYATFIAKGMDRVEGYDTPANRKRESVAA